MKESLDNIRPVDGKEMANRRAEVQKDLPKLSSIVGRYVKKAFSKDGRIEHLWIRITGANENSRTLVGKVDNDPIYVDLKDGDEVVVHSDEIEQVL
jgi:uncharacterized protein YegJ (DUF2314 family)